MPIFRGGLRSDPRVLLIQYTEDQIMPSAILAVLLGIQAAPAAAPAVTLPEAAELRRQIEAADADFFRLLFLGCDPARARAGITADLEFYHDRGGATLGADAFIAIYERQCRERQEPNAWRSRRELVPGTLTVDPVPGLRRDRDRRACLLRTAGRGPRAAGRPRPLRPALGAEPRAAGGCRACSASPTAPPVRTRRPLRRPAAPPAPAHRR